ncbi:hypothetical protein [Azospirillum soli]|uniref:hypothetical protein n=1 Tax=Azospirillum soli TaxID=1304799 RepID=UPI001AE1D400|nr:hypothetical protein [Azospirillum soli]MBP2311876.1 hypothetical protein [Azospirillum soli]
MRKPLPLLLAAAGTLTAAPAVVAWADDPTVNGLIAAGIQTLGLAAPLVQAMAIAAGAGLLAWRMWLNRPQPASNHTTDEIFQLLNGLSERVDGLSNRINQHVDQHHRHAA